MKGFEPTDFMERRAARRMDRFAQLAVAAGRLALEDAGLTVADDMRPRVGAASAAASAGSRRSCPQTLIVEQRGPDRPRRSSSRW